ncbi:MAG: alpha/beta hydrolase [Sphingomonadaceae bacterium]
MSAARSIQVPLRDGMVHALCWDGPPDAPCLVFLHATGMCAAVYAPLLAPLAAELRILAVDARGHGATSLPADPAVIPVDWKPYREDLAGLVAALGPGPVLLAGHSFGATVVAETAAAHPGLAQALLLLDPAFIPFAHAAAFAAERASGGSPPNLMAEGAARRRARFESRAAARQSWQARGVFRGWPEEALDAYVAHGLVDDDLSDEGGGVTLACAPAWEATSFRGVSTTLEASLAQLSTPFVLLAGDEGSTVQPDDFEAMARHRACRHAERFTGTGHFFPVTHPELVRPHLAALARPAPGR